MFGIITGIISLVLLCVFFSMLGRIVKATEASAKHQAEILERLKEIKMSILTDDQKEQYNETIRKEDELARKMYDRFGGKLDKDTPHKSGESAKEYWLRVAKNHENE